VNALAEASPGLSPLQTEIRAAMALRPMNALIFGLQGFNTGYVSGLQYGLLHRAQLLI